MKSEWIVIIVVVAISIAIINCVFMGYGIRELKELSKPLIDWLKKDEKEKKK